jgi:intermembrane space import and assembly protein 40
LQDPAASLDPENTHTPDPFSSQPEAESSPGSPNSDALNDEVTTGASDPDDKEDASSDAGSSSGAFNPVTGEINWDCPCLGGMAHGPCGPQFREAFSCFVFSEEEPKGINCVEKFKAMQTCFREHPDIYGDGTWFLYLHSPVIISN